MAWTWKGMKRSKDLKKKENNTESDLAFSDSSNYDTDLERLAESFHRLCYFDSSDVNSRHYESEIKGLNSKIKKIEEDLKVAQEGARILGAAIYNYLGGGIDTSKLKECVQKIISEDLIKQWNILYLYPRNSSDIEERFLADDCIEDDTSTFEIKEDK